MHVRRHFIFSGLGALLAALTLLPGTAAMAPVQTLTIPARTYQPGVTSGSRALPAGVYTAFHITANYSPWTSPLTTNVRLGISLSYDGGATFDELCSAGENTPPPWTIPAKYGGGVSSTVALDCFIGADTRPTNVAGFVDVAGAAVPLGQIVVSLS